MLHRKKIDAKVRNDAGWEERRAARTTANLRGSKRSSGCVGGIFRRLGLICNASDLHGSAAIRIDPG
jgi:hypothetical protein